MTYSSFGSTLSLSGNRQGRPTLGNENIVVVTGAGGFIGGNLVAALRWQGFTRIRAVDIKPFEEWYQRFGDVENLCLDLNSKRKLRKRRPKMPAISTISRQIWEEWASLSTTKPSACSRCSNQHASAAGGGWKYDGKAIFLFFFRLCLQRRQAEKFRKRHRSRKKTRIQLWPKMATAGKNYFLNGCAGIFREDFGCIPRVARFHNVYGPWGHGTAAGRRPLPQFAEK